jgi:hypothetical protein
MILSAGLVIVRKEKDSWKFLFLRAYRRYYLAETSQSEVTFSINPQMGNPEHHEYRWLTFQDIKNLAPERLLPIIDWAQGIIKNPSIFKYRSRD